MLRKLTTLAALIIVVVCLATALWPRAPRRVVTTTTTTAAATTETLTRGITPITPPAIPPLVLAAPLAIPVGGCGGPASLQPAAADNAVSVASRDWAPWGRAERGWETYRPLIAQEIGTACGPDSPGFADALSRWQLTHKLPADGMLTAQTFEILRVLWLRRRPFVQAFSKGVCPAAADPAVLAWMDKAEGYSGKPNQLRPDVLAAYRAMLAAARQDVAEVAQNRQLLTVFSGYRAPAQDEARCDRDSGCGTIIRVRCSAHRTGTVIDINLGAAPGSRPDSSEDFNRLYQSRTTGYRCMVANAGRFGFVPYPFEPWHWEWAGLPTAAK